MLLLSMRLTTVAFAIGDPTIFPAPNEELLLKENFSSKPAKENEYTTRGPLFHQNLVVHFAMTLNNPCAPSFDGAPAPFPNPLGAG